MSDEFYGTLRRLGEFLIAEADRGSTTLVAPARASKNQQLYGRAGRMLRKVQAGEVTVLNYKAKGYEVGYGSRGALGLVGSSYIKLSGDRYVITSKGRARLRWIEERGYLR